MRYNTGYNREGDYDHFVVSEERPLLEWLIANVPQSKSKVKAVLQGRGIKVNGKTGHRRVRHFCVRHFCVLVWLHCKTVTVML
jgi:hypothetical protein